MPSPFPGMDPFIESQQWQTFHTRMINSLGDSLVERVRPRYIVSVGSIALAEAVVCTLPRLEEFEIEQEFLTIESRDLRHVVTMVELLSPWNKSPGDGRAQYLRKRHEAFAAGVHIVELDLLRGGQRLPTVEPPPAGDYYAFVCRKERYPQADVFAWSLRNSLPNIPIPLAEGDDDISLTLQSVFNAAFQRAGFDYALDYDRPLEPAVDEATQSWLREQLNTQRGE